METAGEPRVARGTLVSAALVVLAVVAVVAGAVLNQRRNVKPLVGEPAAAARTVVDLTLEVDDATSPRTIDPYRGLGAWVDGFDFAPAYTGPNPPVTAADLEAMASNGVRTLYLQASRVGSRSPDVLENRFVLATFLQEAHRHDIAVVAWYLPKWTDDDADIDRLRAMADFEAFGHRFDGVAVDIEWTDDGLEPTERGRRLVALSRKYREHLGDDPLGAIVLPPVLTDVVNEQFWPEFPWTELEPLYDVWLPMSYWSFRSEESGYDDGYVYNTESTERLRAHLGDPDAVVHAIGGIGGIDGVDDPADPEEPLARLEQFDDFARSIADTGALGGSVYDWRTLEPAARERLDELLGDEAGRS
ncbi:MAG: hypothetical protein HKN26_15720 [Acidimicrobiales bacterium]|nr:hypothetical protein [Acidimicrobiales bacterium]